MNLVPRDSIFNLDRFFNHSFPSTAETDEWDNTFFSPRVDIRDKKDHYEITAEMPGVKKDDISVTLEDGVLTLSAKTDEEKTEEKDGKIIRRERRSGNYMRSFSLGGDVQQSDISATFENGVLALSVPKVEEKKPQSKTITIN